MSMEHKAFVFDTEMFHAKIEPVMKESINHPEVARQYISANYEQLQSPYTGEMLEENWEEEFDELTLQVYFDILLTACYDVEDDCGLGYLWDAVNGIVGALDAFEEPQMAVLGRNVVINGVKVDPGMMGLGLVESHEIQDILDRLQENRDEAEDIEPEDLQYDADPEEWMEAYDGLCSVYEEAGRQGKGLLFTF